MELSSDNIEELAKILSSKTSHQNDVFGEKSKISTLDVDRVISEAQDSLLNTSLEAIRSSSGPTSFNDILDDICKMNNNIELQQAAVNTATPQLPLEHPAFYHMPDLEMQSEDYTSVCSYSNPTDFLQPLGQWSDYLPLPPSALSTVQDIPTLAPIPTVIPTPPPQPIETPQIIYSRDVPTVNVNQINPNVGGKTTNSYTPVAPVQIFNNYEFNIPTEIVNNYPMQQIEMPNSNLHMNQAPERNTNFMVVPELPEVAPRKRFVQQQLPPFFDWARVVPRRAFIQPSEIVVLRPLRTRKVMSSRPSFDLASYFDTSTISIPMIREKPRCRTYRRKQKLYTIPGADNLIFEVQLDRSDDKGDNNEDQLYPDTEIPELDEIFKRKRRILHTRRNPPYQDRIKTPPQKDRIKTPSPQTIEVPKQMEVESPPPNTELEFLSDVDSDDAPLNIVKSMKCSNCRKIFKTCRSLTIHSKRCNIFRCSPQKEQFQDIFTLPKTTCEISIQIDSCKENIDLKKQKQVAAERVTTRPLTRSQTRNALKRKATENGGCAPKQSK